MIDLTKVPVELRNRKQWICWRKECRTDKDGKEKVDKVPTCVDGKRNASSTNEETWSTFEDACAAVEKHGLAGVGFVFSPDDPFCGIDFDGCREGNIVRQEVAMITKKLDTYTEISPSGRGLHCICKAILPPGARRKGKMEMYDCGRFFTVTGEMVPWSGKEIAERQVEVVDLWTKHINSGQRGAAPPPQADKSKASAEVGDFTVSIDSAPPWDKFAFLCSTVPKFNATWEHTRRDLDTSSSGYEQSLASQAVTYEWTDQEIANLIVAHRKRWQPEKIDKALRADYIKRTLLRARTGFLSGEQEKITAEAAAIAETDDDTIDAKLERVRAVCGGLPVLKVLKVGITDCRYWLVLDGNRRIPLGRFEALQDRMRFKKSIVEYVKTARVQRMRREAWESFADMMISISDEIIPDESRPEESARSAVQEYLESTITDASENDYTAWKEAFANKNPFIREKEVWIQARALRLHLANHGENLNAQDARNLLVSAGFSPVKESARVNGRVYCRCYWRAPSEPYTAHLQIDDNGVEP